ncbi:50S ribosomal protein L31e [Salarchaeum japonicum]|uniref:50S ribosomal protein L31e n=1 Tax=Salarchaeum japonicum TaxID=555573 RepID=UPI003C71E5EA
MSASDFEERIVTVPLRDVLAEPKHERAGKAMTLIREHLAKHFSVDEDAVRLDPSINEVAWARGQKKPPSKVRVRAARFEEEGEPVVEAEYADE